VHSPKQPVMPPELQRARLPQAQRLAFFRGRWQQRALVQQQVQKLARQARWAVQLSAQWAL
jgi:hypothetical protein